MKTILAVLLGVGLIGSAVAGAPEPFGGKSSAQIEIEYRQRGEDALRRQQATQAPAPEKPRIVQYRFQISADEWITLWLPEGIAPGNYRFLKSNGDGGLGVLR